MSQNQVDNTAHRQAQRDWEQHQARYLLCGNVMPKTPRLHQRSGLYLAVYADPPTEQDLRFCATYNATIQSLLQTVGLPSWAPGYRLPSRDTLIAWLYTSHPMSTYMARSIQEKRLIDGISTMWPSPPQVWQRRETEELLLIGGDINPRAGRIDVIDTREGVWMVSKEYRRRHSPHFPWDATHDHN
jgi:hypothetical protein